MTKVGIIGDLHGNKPWSIYALQRLQNEGVTNVWQLGDFGIGLADSRFVNGVDAFLRSAKMILWVTPGNHEDYDIIDDLPVAPDGKLVLTDNIFFFPRGHRFTVGGRSVVSLGGAPSVDRSYRLAMEERSAAGRAGRRLWWTQEQITRADVDKVVAGGHADIMLAHDAPHSPTIEARIAGNPHGFPKNDIEYAEKGRKLMDEAFMAVQPKVFLHGHYHFPVNDLHKLGTKEIGYRESRVIGFDADQSEQSFGIIDLDTLDVTALPDQRYLYLLHQGWSENEARSLVGAIRPGHLTN